MDPYILKWGFLKKGALLAFICSFLPKICPKFTKFSMKKQDSIHKTPGSATDGPFKLDGYWNWKNKHSSKIISSCWFLNIFPHLFIENTMDCGLIRKFKNILISLEKGQILLATSKKRYILMNSKSKITRSKWYWNW